MISLAIQKKDEVAEIFKPYSDGEIYGTIMKFSKNTDLSRSAKSQLNKSLKMCKDIYEALKGKSHARYFQRGAQGCCR